MICIFYAFYLHWLDLVCNLYDCYRYASSFRFSGDYVDLKDTDSVGRRKTRIIAIDALCSPGKRQYGSKCLLRYINLVC